jgi:hypothetical protein
MQAKTLKIELNHNSGAITLWNEKTGQRLMIIDDPALFCPALDGERVRAQMDKTEETDNRILFRFKADGLRDFTVKFEASDDTLEISSSFAPERDCELNRLDLFPEGTMLNMYDVVNFRNRHHTPHIWPELNLGGKGFETETYSTDWQFAPHPTMFILRKDDISLFVGALDLPKAFGMYLKVEDYKVKHWYLDYGQTGFGQKLKAGETFQSPKFAVFLDHGKSVYETIDRYLDVLVRNKSIPDPRTKKTYPWHTENLYCTWLDQCFRSKAARQAELSEQDAMATTAINVMNESLVREALAVIKREELPFRTFLLDDGWQITRGQWEAHPERFPDLRGVIDEIHDAGMKVILWWGWPDIYDDAEVTPEFLIDGGRRNRHGRRMWDFSNPRTQQEYLEPLLRKFFSSEPDCYDADGIKTDFMADKVHADMPLHDPQWRGEENYFYRLCERIHKTMKKYKPDACHIGCAGHPWLSRFMDVNRTYDVASSDAREHLNRGLMLRSTAPATQVAFDLHGYIENCEKYLELARENGFAVEIGNILMTQQDRFSDYQPADESYYDLLRKNLSQVEERQ